jgi:TPR repeat protein
LGICCEEGHGTPKDLIAAKAYYQLAADQNHADGTNNLAYIYLLEVGDQFVIEWCKGF